MIPPTRLSNKSDARPRKVVVQVNGSEYRLPVWKHIDDIERWARCNLMPSERAEFFVAYERARADIDTGDL